MPFNDKQKNKLLRTLSKWGVSTDEAAAFLEDANADDEPEMEAEAAQAVEAEPEQEPIIDGGQPAEAEAPAAEPAEEPQATEPQVEEPQAAEAEPLQEQPAQEEIPAIQEPLPDPRVDELEKAVEGISSRLDAFIDSLKKAGVLVETPEQVGVESQGFGSSNGEESLGDTLNRLNRGKTY